MKRSIVAFLKGIIPVIAALVFLVSVSACQREGTMEKAGKKIDKSLEATKDAMKEAGDKVKEGGEKTKEAVEHAAETAREKITK
ncbi:MAG TPA: hypothetical protein VHO84_10825 [Syntrophorhabdaceae bacterium]|nr:hypothetical protein [Syntrophorhabdaceae bacterium]